MPTFSKISEGVTVMDDGGGWVLIGTSVASGSASLTQTGLDSTYGTYAILLSDIVPSTDEVVCYMQMGDSNGIDSGASDYMWHTGRVHTGSASTYLSNVSASDSKIELGASLGMGTGTGEGLGAVLYLVRPGNGTMYPTLCGTYTQIHASSAYKSQGGNVIACRLSVISLDRILIKMSSGNIASGRFSVYGIPHS